MDSWVLTCLTICAYGFFKEVRPSEYFLTEYLKGPWQNLTDTEIIQLVYPLWTYSYLGHLVVVLLVTDLLRYKPVIVFEAFAYVLTFCILIWGKGLQAMQWMSFFHGTSSSTDIGYYTYMYVKVPSSQYQKVTSYTRAATLVGRFVSGLSSQVLISSGLMDYCEINFVTLGSVIIAMIIALCLPTVSHSVYFHREAEPGETPEEETPILTCSTEGHKRKQDVTVSRRPKKSFSSKARNACSLLWSDFKFAFTQTYIIKWSIWWVFATCGNLQLSNYSQPLWEVILASSSDKHLYNGAVEAMQTFLSAIMAFSLGYMRLNWSLLGDVMLVTAAFVSAVMLFIMAQASSLWVSYLGYVVFRVTYQMTITVTNSEVAKSLCRNSFGLVFGINICFALLAQTILTLVVVDGSGLGYPPRLQFVVYSSYYVVLGVVFLAIFFYTVGRTGFSNMLRKKVWLQKE